ncbi:isocitrate lyase/phosphoenolpyruvate mutase family protein [Pseudoalteromonas sp. JBTF-M23]|uniref:Isocitrate lyase/phosphoenolpyruvate mutase family protein n=1 Tax=Pseudoalteromonas caenipelagi TaxID=2726988 RepID=A0A849VJ71_9GAMM|nr:isocitrate lyase/phosphoenolpyruvate mutase family protein [Pseudoalteromonas caenipelagi]NOU51687.1 isocitrate lyase/phosphoenolpyruvate mutase family protein [Pseudoalteromonas caenipelagi]
MTFKDLHTQTHPLLLGNVWDVPSAQIAEQLGFAAIGTSSAAIANMLGKQDGEALRFDELLIIVTAIAQHSNLPLSVDIEAGYADSPLEVANNIIKLAKLGVVGINIEDSTVVNGQRTLVDAEEFARKLIAIKAQLTEAQVDLFINVRSDTYLLGVEKPLEASLQRAALYQDAGADGLFLPCLHLACDIQIITSATTLPINVMCVPELLDFATLKTLGVKRISMGNFVHQAMLSSLKAILTAITTSGAFAPLFDI